MASQQIGCKSFLKFLDQRQGLLSQADATRTPVLRDVPCQGHSKPEAACFVGRCAHLPPHVIRVHHQPVPDPSSMMCGTWKEQVKDRKNALSPVSANAFGFMPRPSDKRKRSTDHLPFCALHTNTEQWLDYVISLSLRERRSKDTLHLTVPSCTGTTWT